MKGIILAGGKGTRLYPSTFVISKGLVPIYDKPMIYYPLSILMLAGIREILVISTPEHISLYEALLSAGSKLGLKIEYTVQEKPCGLAQSFILAEDFVGTDSVCLILGDNIFYGQSLTDKLKKSAGLKEGGVIFGYHVENPQDFGVATVDNNNRVISVEEKPQNPTSNYAIPGLYFFDNKCVEYAKEVKPSKRGELEITCVIERYVKNKNLSLEILGRGTAWLDTGTHENLMEASEFVHIIEKRQGLKVACLEEIAYAKGFINFEQLKQVAKHTEKSDYGIYLRNIIKKIEQGKLPIHNTL